jgi:hypothetical protein
VSDQGITASEYNISSQFAHFFTAYALVFTLGHFCGWKGLLTGALAMLAWSTPKEFWYDARYENAAVRGSSLLDWAMYQAGSLAAAAVNVLVRAK